MDKKLDLGRVIEHNKPKEVKEVTSIRLTNTDKELLLDAFGSVQKAVDALLKEIKG